MKNILRPVTGIFLASALLTSMLAIQGVHFGGTNAQASQDQNRHSQANVNEEKTERGPKVAKRVNNLKRLNKDVRNALKMFEDNERRTGRRPKVEESWMLTGKASTRQARKNCKDCSPMTMVSFRPQDPVFDNGIEMIFIPTYSVPGQWQGTVIVNRYDEAGTFLQQYVADVAIVEEPGAWNVIYEVSFEQDGAWLESDPALGMVTDTSFVFGMPIEDQPITITRTFRRPEFRNASFGFPQRLVGPGGIGMRNSMNPRVRRWAGCTAATCLGVGGVGCAVATLFGVPFPACAATACSGGAARCVLVQIFDTN